MGQQRSLPTYRDDETIEETIDLAVPTGSCWQQEQLLAPHGGVGDGPAPGRNRATGGDRFRQVGLMGVAQARAALAAASKRAETRSTSKAA
jgi:hypothetical protein